MSGPGAPEIRRKLPAGAAEVFEWWTDADRLRQWMSPVGTVEAEVDLRVGGALRIVMRHEGTVIEHLGKYLEIEPPRRLVFTWASPFTGPDPSLVTVELEPDGPMATNLRIIHTDLVTVELEPDGPMATNLRIIHTDLPESVATSHRDGWGAMLDRLSGCLLAAAAR